MHHIQRDILRIKTFMELLLGGEKERERGRASLAILAMSSRPREAELGWWAMVVHRMDEIEVVSFILMLRRGGGGGGRSGLSCGQIPRSTKTKLSPKLLRGSLHSFSSICREVCAQPRYLKGRPRPRCMKRGHEIKGSHCATKPPPYSKARACYVPRSAQSCAVVQNFEALCQRNNKLLLPRQIRVMLSRLQKCAAKRRPCGYLWLWRSRVLRVVRRSAVRPSILLRPSSSSARATDDGARLPHICAALAFASDERETTKMAKGELNPLSATKDRRNFLSLVFFW